MNKIFENLILELKRFLKTDLKKLISLLIIFYISIIVPMYIFAFIMVTGLKKEGEQREKEIDRLYKEGICNVHEPCYYP